MSFYNLNIPHFYCLLRKEHLYQNKKHFDEYEKVTVFGAQSSPDRAMLFHVMLDNGTVRSRVPIHMLCHKPVEKQDLDFLQLWDCFSENVSVIHYDFLAFHRVQVVLRDGSKVWGEYMFTVDWFNNPYSDEPSDYKCGHVFASDDGYLLCMPNNRIFWKDSNWVTKSLQSDLKQFKVDNHIPSVENVSDRWVSEDTDSFYYDIIKE